MHFDLTDEQQDIRRLVRDFADGEVRPVAEELDREKRFPYEIVAKLGELGLMGIPYPEEYGGGGADNLSYAIAIEELARVDSSVAITVAAHTSLGTWPLYAFGSDEQKAEWMPRLCSGEQLRRVRAHRARGGLRRRQRAHPRGAGRRGLGDQRREAVHHQQRHRHLGLRHDHRAHGRRRGLEPPRPERHAGLRGRRAVPQDGLERLRHAPARFEDCRVPEENLVGPRGQGFKQFLQTLDGGRIGVSAMGVGLAQGALDEALAYAKERQAFGQPISKYQAIQMKLADLSTEIEAARLLTYKAAIEKDLGRNFSLTAAQAKLKTGRLAVRATEEAVQIHGGYGYIEEYPVCRFYRDAKILTIGEGTDEVQQMVIARALGA